MRNPPPSRPSRRYSPEVGDSLGGAADRAGAERTRPMMNLDRLCVLTLMVTAMAGCSKSHDDSPEPTPGVSCLDNLRYVPGIVVEVRDMLTNDPIASDAVGTLQ